MTIRTPSAGAFLALLTVIAFAGCAKSQPEATASESTEATAEPSSEAAAEPAMPSDEATPPADAPKQ